MTAPAPAFLAEPASAIAVVEMQERTPPGQAPPPPPRRTSPRTWFEASSDRSLWFLPILVVRSTLLATSLSFLAVLVRLATADHTVRSLSLAGSTACVLADAVGILVCFLVPHYRSLAKVTTTVLDLVTITLVAWFSLNRFEPGLAFKDPDNAEGVTLTTVVVIFAACIIATRIGSMMMSLVTSCYDADHAGPWRPKLTQRDMRPIRRTVRYA
ncbi:hypothetical protein SEUCBS139899_010723 [Sporothrix eucalyptigena]|uniref:MARVEL domain-containing protein n=1 Tax=Sporothrix eucalyptigena TaxID=1812306 RepID=A0ABP0BVF6_9PEZI